MPLRRIGLLLLAGLALWLPSVESQAINTLPLPRALGPIYLGMTEEAYGDIIGPKSIGPDELVPGEYFWGIEASQRPDLFQKIGLVSRHISGRFFAGKIFEISFDCEFGRIEGARREYEKKFGSVSEVDNWPNGTSWLIWNDANTLVKIAYTGKRTENNDSPVGTVHGVYYLDKAVQTARWKSPFHPNPSVDLPRSFGPLVLGMSVDAYAVITGFDPRSVWCASCAEGELAASLALTHERAKRFGATYFVNSTMQLNYQKNLMPEDVDCRFIREKLYSIEMSSILGNVLSVTEKYRAALGKPTWSMRQEDGINIVIWESPSTRMELIYSDKPGSRDYLKIQYLDMDLLGQWPPPEIK